MHQTAAAGGYLAATTLKQLYGRAWAYLPLSTFTAAAQGTGMKCPLGQLMSPAPVECPAFETKLPPLTAWSNVLVLRSLPAAWSICTQRLACSYPWAIPMVIDVGEPSACRSDCSCWM